MSMALFEVFKSVSAEDSGLLQASWHDLRLVKLRFFAGKIGKFKLFGIYEQSLVRYRTQVDFDLWQVANNWLILAAFDALERSQDLELFVALLVLFNWLLTRIVVLLVTQQDMVQQGAFRRQESACHLQRFCVPILTLKLSITFNFWLKEVCPWLQKKPHLSRHAEVAHRKDRQILQEHIATKL